MAYIQKDAFLTANFSDVSGGINIARPPDLIADNECEELLNIEFDFNRPKVRCGLSSPVSTYGSNIMSVFYIPYSNSGIVVLENGEVYEDDFHGGIYVVGTINGTKRPSFCRYDEKTFIASGGKLQYIEFPQSGSSTIGQRIFVNSNMSSYDAVNMRFVVNASIFSSTALTATTYRVKIAQSSAGLHSLVTVDDSYDCSIVFERAGRLATADTGSDRIHYSAVGNPYDATEVEPEGSENPHNEGWYEKDALTGDYFKTEDTAVDPTKTYYYDCGGWQEETDVDSSYKWIDVGYKADGDILAVVPMASDLLIFKSGGTVYSLASEYPNWTIVEVSKNTDVTSSDCVVAIPNSVAFVSTRGLFGINPSVAYGNFNIEELGYKVNMGIAYSTNNPRTYSIVRKSQLLMCPNTLAKPNEILCYHWTTKAFTRLSFPTSLGSVRDVSDTTDGPIIAIGKNLYRWADEYQDDNGVPIESLIKTKVLLGNDKIITRSIDSLFIFSNDNKQANITIRDIERDNHVVSVNVPTNARKKILCNHSSRKIQLEVTANSRYELEHLSIEAAGFSR